MAKRNAPKRTPHVRWKKTGSTGIVLNLKTGDYFELDKSAFAIWRLIDGKRSIREMARTLSGAYRVPIATMEKDVAAFVSLLRKRKLITQ